MSKLFVVIMVGSNSDLGTMQTAIDTLSATEIFAINDPTFAKKSHTVHQLKRESLKAIDKKRQLA